MKIADIRRTVEDVPYMSVAQAKAITDIILENQYQNILELGFLHGVSTCYMAGALDELGKGHITTIDRMDARGVTPNIEQLLSDLGLTKFVTTFYEPSSYIWRLMKMLEENPAPRFDFCYIDGAHNWETDGFAFFLVDKLLKADGRIIFDDLDWTYDSSPALKETQYVRSMTSDEKSTPQIRKVYELLVKPHPAYGDFMERDGLAYARKMPTELRGVSGEVRREVVVQREYVGCGAVLLKIGRRVLRIGKRRRTP